MTLKPVQSSHLSAIGHDAATNTLTVEFARGSTYSYANVSPADFDALEKAPSIGSHFIANIQRHPEKYPFTRHKEPAKE